MTLPDHRLAPMRELARSIEGVSGTRADALAVRAAVRLRRATRRAASGATACRSRRCGAEAVAVANWDAGHAAWRDDGVEARFDIAAGGRALLALARAYAEPLVLPGARRRSPTRLERHDRVLGSSGRDARTLRRPVGRRSCCAARSR